MNDTTEIPTTTTAAAEPKEKENAFLGLYFPAELKAKVAAAAAADERSMSQFAVRVFKSYFESHPTA